MLLDMLGADSESDSYSLSSIVFGPIHSFEGIPGRGVAVSWLVAIDCSRVVSASVLSASCVNECLVSQDYVFTFRNSPFERAVHVIYRLQILRTRISLSSPSNCAGTYNRSFPSLFSIIDQRPAQFAAGKTHANIISEYAVFLAMSICLLR